MVITFIPEKIHTFLRIFGKEVWLYHLSEADPKNRKNKMKIFYTKEAMYYFESVQCKEKLCKFLQI